MHRIAGSGRDALAIGALLSTALVIAWPILRGGHLTYVDNPVHLAEIQELAFYGSGWSELGFAGFPLGTLHSPLWYPALAAAVRLGLRLEPLYAAMLVAGFVAPALAVYGVARQRTAPLWALLLAYVVLVQAPMVRGVGSPLAGMWTHGLGAAGVVLLAHGLARPRLGAAAHLGVAALLALVALTHLFALVAGALVMIVTTTLHHYDEKLSRRELAVRAVDCAVAALAASAYWLTFVLTTRPELAPQDPLRPLELLVYLLLPSEVLYLQEGQIANAIRYDLWLSESILRVGLLVAGVLGFRRSAQRDVLTRSGFSIAVVALAALLIHPYVPIGLLGPVSFRHATWIELGAALSAIAWLRELGERRRPSRLAWPALPALLVVLGLWWGKPLRNDRPAATAEEWRELEALWQWLAAQPKDGRVYLQDTFGQGWTGGLTHSHVLALSRSRTGALQLGVYYGVVPYKTRWTLSEFGRLFSDWQPAPSVLDYNLKRSNVRLLVASSRQTAALLAASGVVERVHAVGRYSVWRPKSTAGWIDPLLSANQVSKLGFDVGAVRFDLVTSHSRPRVVLKTSWHPWWTVEAPSGIGLSEVGDGMLAVRAPGPGRYAIALRYVPSPWPLRLTLLGWLILAGWGAALVAHKRRRLR